MKGRYLGWRAILWFVAAYHLAMGLILFSSGELALQVARQIGGVQIQGSPELGVLSEILACYVMVFGLMVALAAWDPIKYRGLLTVAIVLFGLRILQRLIFADKVMEVFHVAPGSHYTGTVIVALFAVALGIFRIQIARNSEC